MRFLFILALIFSACGQPSTDSYVKDFKENEENFNAVIKILKEKYLYNSKYKDEVRLIFLNCDKFRRTIKYERCDSVLIQYMNELKLKKIMIEDAEDDSIKFDRIAFVADNPDNSYVEYIHTPWKNYGKDFKDDKYEI